MNVCVDVQQANEIANIMMKYLTYIHVQCNNNQGKLNENYFNLFVGTSQ